MINTLIFDYNKNDTVSHIENSRFEKIGMFLTKIQFYNPCVDEPLHKFWFFIPNSKVIKTAHNMIHVVFSRNDKKLINSINSLDNLTDVYIIQNNNNIKNIQPSIIQSDNYPPVFELIIDNYTQCYDENNNIINHECLYSGEKIQLYIEFDYVIINNRSCSRRWRVLQMKKEKKMDMNINLFITPIKKPQRQFIPPPPSHNIPQNIVSKNNKPISVTDNETKYIAPTANQLLDALNQMKNKKKKNKIIVPIVNKTKIDYEMKEKEIEKFKQELINDQRLFINDKKKVDIIISDIEDIIAKRNHKKIKIKKRSIFESDSSDDEFIDNKKY